MAKPKARRIDFYPDEFIAGVTAQLGLAEFAVYWMVCALIYSRGGPIPDDASWIAGTFKKANPRSIAAALDELVRIGKVMRSNGELMVNRCRDALEAALNRIRSASENGSNGGRPPKENKEIEKAGGLPEEKLTSTSTQPPTSDTSLRSVSEGLAEDAVDLLGKAVAPATDVLTEALIAYNAIAGELGLPIAQRLNEARRGGLRARLAEVGGLAGWLLALEKLREAPHCLGQNDRGWRADLDFLLQSKSFTRLIEGFYGNKPPPNTPTRVQRPAALTERERREIIFAVVADELAPGRAAAAGDEPGRAGDGARDISPGAEAGRR